MLKLDIVYITISHSQMQGLQKTQNKKCTSKFQNYKLVNVADCEIENREGDKEAIVAASR